MGGRVKGEPRHPLHSSPCSVRGVVAGFSLNTQLWSLNMCKGLLRFGGIALLASLFVPSSLPGQQTGGFGPEIEARIDAVFAGMDSTHMPGCALRGHGRRPPRVPAGIRHGESGVRHPHRPVIRLPRGLGVEAVHGVRGIPSGGRGRRSHGKTTSGSMFPRCRTSERPSP